MSNKQTVNIGGHLYDAHTGLSVDSAVVDRHPHADAGQIHTTVQHSQTLDRSHTKKPVATPRPATNTQKHATVSRSSAISRFSPHPQISQTKPPVMDIRPAKKHPLVIKAEAVRQAKTSKAEATTIKPSDIIKKEAIANSLKDAPAHAAGARQIKKQHAKRSRVLSIISASFALILLAGYLTYLNMPSLSVRVAAAQAGINASYPQYHPDGYSLNGTISYKEGEVAMTFASNAGPQNYSLTQQKSAWDSSAVQEFVTNKTKGQYLTNTDKGLTIYTYGSNAAWVNGGILYTISGDAPLSSDQIQRIATSM